jgi:hypothetical protein
LVLDALRQSAENLQRIDLSAALRAHEVTKEWVERLERNVSDEGPNALPSVLDWAFPDGFDLELDSFFEHDILRLDDFSMEWDQVNEMFAYNPFSM